MKQNLEYPSAANNYAAQVYPQVSYEMETPASRIRRSKSRWRRELVTGCWTR